MGVGTNIRKLGHFLEECEEGFGTVDNVEFTECGETVTGLSADIELTVTTGQSDRRGAVTPAAVEIGADGRLQLVLQSTEPVVRTTDPDLEMEPRGAAVDDDGTITVRLDASVPNNVGRSDADETRGDERSSSPDRERENTDEPAERGRDRDLPPFRDPELLAEVYESCETFAEMADAIEMDVTAETVRRYMIDHGIHEPNSYDTDGEGADESESVTDNADDRPGNGPGTEGENDQTAPVVLTDGIGLPDEVSLDALVEAVSQSNTVYEVTQEVGLSRDETVELLRRLNLVDLVVGRIASEYERDIGREEIVARLRDAPGAQPST